MLNKLNKIPFLSEIEERNMIKEVGWLDFSSVDLNK